MKTFLLILVTVLFTAFSSFANIVVTPATGGTGIQGYTAQNGSAPAFTTLTTITIAEGANGDFKFGNARSTIKLVLKAPANWVFNPDVGSISYKSAGDVSGATITVASDSITISLTGKKANTLDSVFISGIQVQEIDGSKTSEGNIVPGISSQLNKFTGLSNTTNFGTLSGDGALPVELTSFTSSVNANVVTLNWETATEKNNYGFDVERKASGQSWVKIGFVQGAGISNVAKQYSFADNNVVAGSYSYRLKQIDNDGTFKYLPAIEVTVGAQPVSFAIGNYPNPFNPSTVIRYSLPSNEFVNISIYNMLGQKVATLVNQRMEQGVHEVSFNANSFATGAYIYRIEAGGYSATKKMLLLK